MQFEEIMNEIKDIAFDTVRIKKEYYFEAVILKENLPALTEKLKKLFGEQLYSSGKKLPPDAEKAVADFGGIMPGQSLYFLKEGDSSYFAMLWPWADELHITLKLGWK